MDVDITSVRQILYRFSMTKRHQKDPSRSLDCNLWGRPTSPYNKRQTPPGGRRRQKPSDYGVQLQGKQRLKKYYGNIGEKQFRKYYQLADKRKGDTSENLLGLLERRLDAVLYRMKFAPTPFGARQLINHGHVLVNGQRTNVPSYSVNDNDVITLTEKGKNIPMVLQAVESAEREIPDYVTVDQNKFTGSFVREPKSDEIPYPVQMEPNLVIEYYSR